MISAPKIDPRDAESIVAQLRTLGSPLTPGLEHALARVFARYCEIVIERINRAPERAFLAFLDIVGSSPLPPRAARAPLTFIPVAGAPPGIIVPEGTPVASAPPGVTEPVVFETESDLPLTTAKFDAFFVKDLTTGTYSNYCEWLERPGAEQVSLFHGLLPIPQAVYVALTLPEKATTIDEVRIWFSLEGAAEPQSWISWEVWDGTNGIPLVPVSDGTAAFSRSGQVVIRDVPKIPLSTVDGHEAQWLRCRMRSSGDPRQMFTIRSVVAHARIQRRGLRLENALTNTIPLDLSKEFFPFGERPRFGDVFMFACDEACSAPGAIVTLNLELLNPSFGGAPGPIPPVNPRNVRMQVEQWNGEIWKALEDAPPGDQTTAFSRNGSASFKIGATPAKLNIGGQEKYWLRVRILQGDYGAEAAFSPSAAGAPPVFLPATLAPPVVRAILLDYVFDQQLPGTTAVGFQDFHWRYFDSGGRAKQQELDIAEQPAVAAYLGFDRVSRELGKPASIYLILTAPALGQRFDSNSPPRTASAWEYWNGRSWRPLPVEDGTGGLRSVGALQFIFPVDMRERQEFGLQRHWIRVVRDPASEVDPRLLAALSNTVIASNSMTVKDEVLGSSSGKPAQVFRASHMPVLEGEHLEVLERVRDGGEQWVKWIEVRSLQSSQPQDRHYVLERETGEVFFGDGARGAVPPAGTGNVRFKRYRAGGGSRGNVPERTINQLRTTLPYVEKVENWVAAELGSNSEPAPHLVQRAPRELRHRGRAVTAQDYEDLALDASPEVARAYCVPLRDVLKHPSVSRRVPGVLTLFLVPFSSDPAPMPSLALFDQVRRHLTGRKAATSEVVLLPPNYLRVNVFAEIVVSAAGTAARTENAVKEELARFLHPVEGDRGAGWRIGVVPQLSSFYAIVESVPGVDHVRSLRIETEPKTVEEQGMFLVCSGAFSISIFIA